MSADATSISAEHFRQILDISRMLAVTTELDALLLRIAEAATSLLNCERASIFLHDPAADQLWTKIALQSLEIRVPSGAGIVGHVFKSNSVLHVPKPYEDPRFNPEPDRKSGFVTRNLLTAPMVDVSRAPVGVIQAVNNRSREGFARAHEAMIQLLADQAGVALQRYHLQRAAVDATYLRREMELASAVQQALIPKSAPEIIGIDAVGWTKPAAETGGDAFDLWKTRDGRLGIFVGDATGHGLAPALVVSQTRTLVRAMCSVNPDPHDLLACANERLNEDLQPGTFVTAFLGFLSSDGDLQWSAAGHGPMLVRANGNSLMRHLAPPGPPLGIMPEFIGKRTRTIRLGSGGWLAVVSDGVFEARSPNDQLFETERLISLLEGVQNASVAAQLDAIRQSMLNWQQKEEPADDQTVVLVRKT